MPSTLSTRGLLDQLTSGDMTDLKLSKVRLETDIEPQLSGPKDRLMPLLSPPAVGRTALGPLPMSHPCQVPDKLWTLVNEKMGVRLNLYNSTNSQFFSTTAVALYWEERQKSTCCFAKRHSATALTTFKVDDQHKTGKFILTCFLEGVYRLKGGLFDNRMRTLLFLLKGSWSWTQEGHIWSMGLILKVPLICGTSFGWPPELEMCVAPEVSIFLLICECQTWMDVSGGNGALQDKKISNICWEIADCQYYSVKFKTCNEVFSPKEVGHETTCSSFSLKFWYSTLSALFNSYFSNEFY